MYPYHSIYISVITFVLHNVCILHHIPRPGMSMHTALTETHTHTHTHTHTPTTPHTAPTHTHTTTHTHSHTADCISNAVSLADSRSKVGSSQPMSCSYLTYSTCM